MTDPTGAGTAARIFGTDGVRGRAGEGWLAPGSVSALGRAVGEVLRRARAAAHRDTPARALIAHDGRRSAAELEAALGRGLAAAGFTVESAGLLPTPGLARLTSRGDYELGLMISASHNPAEDNGIKVFSRSGEKLSDELEEQIERELRAHPEPVSEGPPPRFDPQHAERYLELLLAGPGAGLDLGGLRLVVDCANGAASGIAPRLFTALGAEATAIHAAPDGDNINAGCGSTRPESLRRAVVERGAALGVALDGDADRCLLVDERGALVDGDGVMTVLALDAVREGAWDDRRIVATVMSNRGLHRALREVGVGVVTVGVGDRRVAEALRSERLPLGGEQSGHMLFGDDEGFFGDGLYTALRVLGVMRARGRPLSALAAAFQAFPQVLLNVAVARKPEWSTLPDVQAAVQAAEQALGEDGRVLLRYSGTEPLARVMVEGPDGDTIRAHAEAIAARIRLAIGA